MRTRFAFLVAVISLASFALFASGCKKEADKKKADEEDVDKDDDDDDDDDKKKKPGPDEKAPAPDAGPAP